MDPRKMPNLCANCLDLNMQQLKWEALTVALLDLKTPELWLVPSSQYLKKIRACYPRLWVICLRVLILRPACQ